jgi:hypothetical protein
MELSWMPVGLTRYRHVPEASLVVGHPQEGVFRFSGLFADGGLELAIDGTLVAVRRCIRSAGSWVGTVKCLLGAQIDA